MGTGIVRRRFTVVTSHLNARAVLYWPADGQCVWLECWLPKKVRGTTHVHEFVSSTLESIPAVHHLHFFPGIASFQELAKIHGFRRRGQSTWFYGCLAFSYISRTNNLATTISLRQYVGKTPIFKVVVRGDAAEKIFKAIDRDFRSIKR